ncbi:MAG: hypothetical protein EKK49_19115, partial [Rhodocyclaceae bacterium]
QQAGHKTAPDQRVRSSIRHLQCGSHPHRTASYRPNPVGTAWERHCCKSGRCYHRKKLFRAQSACRICSSAATNSLG